MREQTINKYLLALNSAYSGISNSPFTINIITNEQVTKGYIVPIFKIANWPNISSVNVHAMVGEVSNYAKNLDNELLYITSINSVDGAEFYISIVIEELSKAYNIAGIHDQKFIIDSKTKEFIPCQE